MEEKQFYTDPDTGGRKELKQCDISSIDPVALWMLGKVAGYGASKYGHNNYVKGYPWHLSYAALQRHLMQFWSGADIDEESGQPHLAHAAWHCLALLSFLMHGNGTDDRPINSIRE